MTDLAFYSGNNRVYGSVVIITGSSRAGKSTVGNLLGSCREADFIDEPWPLVMLTILAGAGTLSEALAISMFQTYLVELWHDRILMRNANFRPADQSSIWRQKSPEEIGARLFNVHTREDVKAYTEDISRTLVVSLSDTLPYCRFFWKAIPECQILHVVRDGLDVALSLTRKGWYSDEELLHPLHSSPYRVYRRLSDDTLYHLPPWVELEQEERFLNLSEFARCLYCWRRTMETVDSAAEGEEQEWRQPRLVKSSELFDHPRETIMGLTDALGLTHTELTGGLLSKIYTEMPKIPEELMSEIERDDLRALREIYLKFDMPTHSVDRALSNVSASLRQM